MAQSEDENRVRQLLDKIPSKRARIVIEHILEHGFISSEQLQTLYGYNHPPRAIRDVRESGIPIDTFRIKNQAGRAIAAYRFGDLGRIRLGRLAGRESFPKSLRKALHVQSNGRCGICDAHFDERYFQVDHRIPYEIVGDTESGLPSERFQLVCGSCNRAKSWSCEHCANWLSARSPRVCLGCYWANPESYVHVALREIRRIDIFWDEDEIGTYERLKEMAAKSPHTLPVYVKKVVEKHVESSKDS